MKYFLKYVQGKIFLQLFDFAKNPSCHCSTFSLFVRSLLRDYTLMDSARSLFFCWWVFYVFLVVRWTDCECWTGSGTDSVASRFFFQLPDRRTDCECWTGSGLSCFPFLFFSCRTDGPIASAGRDRVRTLLLPFFSGPIASAGGDRIRTQLLPVIVFQLPDRRTDCECWTGSGTDSVASRFFSGPIASAGRDRVRTLLLPVFFSGQIASAWTGSGTDSFASLFFSVAGPTDQLRVLDGIGYGLSCFPFFLQLPDRRTDCECWTGSGTDSVASRFFCQLPDRRTDCECWTGSGTDSDAPRYFFQLPDRRTDCECWTTEKVVYRMNVPPPKF